MIRPEEKNIDCKIFTNKYIDLSNVETVENCIFVSCSIFHSDNTSFTGNRFEYCVVHHGFVGSLTDFLSSNATLACMTYTKDYVESKISEKVPKISEISSTTIEKYRGQIVSLYDGATIMFVTSDTQFLPEVDCIVEDEKSIFSAKEAFKWLGNSYFWKGKYGVVERFHTDVEDNLDKDELLIRFLDDTFKFITLNKKNKNKLKKSRLTSMAWVATQEKLD